MALPIDAIMRKYQRNAKAAVADIAQAIDNGKDWNSNTLAEKENYKANLQDSLAKDTWAKNVAKTTTSYQRERAKAGFRSGYSSGIDNGLARATQQIGKVTAAGREIAASLPKRGPRGQNNARSAAQADAMIKKKDEGAFD